MKAAVLEAFGEAPTFQDFAEPAAQEEEVLVSVRAAALKQLDRALASGRHYASPRMLPIVCGTDGVGLTSAGDRVYFTTNRYPFGAMAEYAPASWTVPLPADLTDSVGAAIVNPAIGAWLPLTWRGKLKKGQTVLILGATGASGRIAVAAARLLGAAKVVAAGRNNAILQALGADTTVDLTLGETALSSRFAEVLADGVDLVIDYLWGRPTELLFGAIEKWAATGQGDKPIRLVSVGEMASATATLPSTVLRGSKLEVIGSGTGNFPPVEQLQRTVRDILAHASAGAISIDLEDRNLLDVNIAWREPQPRRVVLRV